MRCKLINPNDDLSAYWIHWPSIEPLWLRNDFHPLDPTKLKRTYHNLWFEDIDSPRSHFKIGAIDYNAHMRAIMFFNGRHRTILLSVLVKFVPLALNDDALAQSDVRTALRDPIGKRDELVLPNFPVLSSRELIRSTS